MWYSVVLWSNGMWYVVVLWSSGMVYYSKDNLVHPKNPESAHSANILLQWRRCSTQSSYFHICSSHFLNVAVLYIEDHESCIALTAAWALTLYIYFNGRWDFHLLILALFFSTVLFFNDDADDGESLLWPVLLEPTVISIGDAISPFSPPFSNQPFFLHSPLFVARGDCFLGDLRARTDQYHAHGQTPLIEMWILSSSLSQNNQIYMPYLHFLSSSTQTIFILVAKYIIKGLISLRSSCFGQPSGLSLSLNNNIYDYHFHFLLSSSSLYSSFLQ